MYVLWTIHLNHFNYAKCGGVGNVHSKNHFLPNFRPTEEQFKIFNLKFFKLSEGGEQMLLHEKLMLFELFFSCQMVQHEKPMLFEPFFFLPNGAAQKSHAFWIQIRFFCQISGTKSRFLEHFFLANGAAQKTQAFWTVFSC